MGSSFAPYRRKRLRIYCWSSGKKNTVPFVSGSRNKLCHNTSAIGALWLWPVHKSKLIRQQIDLKNYPERFALCGLPVVKVAINFNTEKHTLEGWKIE